MGPEVRSRSPHGRYRVRVHPWQARTSHWVETPELYDRTLGCSLWRPQDPGCSLIRARWFEDWAVELWLRRYPGDRLPPELCCRIEARRGSAYLADGTEIALGEPESSLAAQLRVLHGGSPIARP